ncbi:thiolase family protein [Metallumcola ferriviriculae]|uniref:acetyl-CoA C-acetyltransferase n=1 Tax=Metallumcola ferriviriculae TaxID=3039180 RepID=A0AAU0URH9_9FIRM|nr:thiolase family protein [Desulfitibacteraceae bacterium MK1]
MGEKEVVIVSAVRTPFGKFGGLLKDIPSIDLGAMVIKEVLNRVDLPGNVLDQVFYGTCIPAETGIHTNIPARQAMLKAGLPPETLSLTIDRACCSSITAVQLAYQAIVSGVSQVVLAAGAENMSRTPLLATKARWGQRIGDLTLIDPLFELGYKEFNPVAVDAGEVALEHDISREDQDLWAYNSQQRYAKAAAEGKFEDELMPLAVPQRRGEPFRLETDESPKPDTSLEKLSKLPTVYGSPTVTAGNAPALSTGASAILLMTEEKAQELGFTPLAKVRSIASIALKPRLLAESPAPAISKALTNATWELDDIDLIEINEAFAAMPLVASTILANGDKPKIEALREKINVNGGAVAMGHPVGASGARILMTLVYELRRRGGGKGVAAICGGLAQGDAVAVEVV